MLLLRRGLSDWSTSTLLNFDIGMDLVDILKSLLLLSHHITVGLVPEGLAGTVIVIGEAVGARKSATAGVVLGHVVDLELELPDEVLVGDVGQDGVDEAVLCRLRICHGQLRNHLFLVV